MRVLNILLLFSVIEFALFVIVGSNYNYGIKEYAMSVGSDELIIYNHAEYFMDSYSLVNTPPKYYISSLLIALSLQFGKWSFILLSFIKLSFHLVAVSFLLNSIKNQIRKGDLYIYGSFLYLNPVFQHYHTLILRDDLILSTILLFVAFAIRLFNREERCGKKQRLMTWLALVSSIVIMLGLRPESAALLVVFFCFVWLLNLGITSRIGLFIALFMLTLLFYENVLLFYSYALREPGWNIFYVLEAFRVFYLSPAPWNILLIVESAMVTDATYLWWWYFITFFTTALSSILLLIYFFKRNYRFFRVNVDNHIGIWFLYFPMFFTVSYGLIATDMVFLGPRQGIVSSALLTLIFIHVLTRSVHIGKAR